jgi:hypothetical protein
MSSLNVYSSTPLSTQLACVFQGVRRAGHELVVRPLSELVPSPTRKQQQRLQDERYALCLQLANIGALLDSLEKGTLVLSAGEEQDLRADRDSLRSRLRGVEAALQVKEPPA